MIKHCSLLIVIVVKTILEINNWYIPILHYFNMRKKDDIIRFRNGTKCIIRNKSDAIAFFEIFFLKTNTNLKDFKIKEDDIIIDVGAHVGYFTIYAARQSFKGKIYAFEPSQSSFRLLEKNIKINKFDNVVIENCAVLNKSGTATLYVNESFSISNSIFRKDINFTKEIVNSISLQDILIKYQIKKIDLLKMDCEGAEFEIILNLTQEHLKKIIKISAEIHNGIEKHTIEELLKFLKANNFNVDYKYLLSDVDNDMPMLYAINKAHMNI